MTPNICHMQRESQIRPHGNPESEWPKHALMLSASPFGDDVSLAFSGAKYDIEEAAKCLALRRATACVFHLMRTMEYSVQRLCAKLGITNVDREWGKLLSSIDEAIKAMGKTDEANDWSEIRSSMYHVKQAWRNTTMHPNKTYTEEQAEEIFRAVKSFLVHLATKV